jgi:tetratricopeptide (TPR) repeat protein
MSDVMMMDRKEAVTLTRIALNTFAAVALTLLMNAPVALGASTNGVLKQALESGFGAQSPAGAQESKPLQATDSKGQALRKYLEAQRLEQAGNFSAAVASYKEAIVLDPASTELRVALGSLYLKNRNVIDAETQARDATKLAPDSRDVKKLVARVYIAQTFVGTSLDKSKAQAAIKELEDLVKSDPKIKIDVGSSEEIPALAVIGDLYLRLEEEDKAIEAFKRISDNDTTVAAVHAQLAQLYLQKAKTREALLSARKAYDLDSKSPEYARLLARSLLRVGRALEAVEIYKKAIGVKSDDKAGLDRGDLFPHPLVFDYAEALVAAGRYDEAKKQLEPIMKIARKETGTYLTAVRITVDALRRAGKREEAVHMLEEALKGQDTSESLPVVYSLAETFEEMLQFDKSIDTYEEALRSIVNPDGSVGNRDQDKQSAALLLRRIANAYRMAGKREKAMETFDRMRKVLGPQSPLPDQLLIDYLLNEGKSKEAYEAATAAVERFPDERAFKLFRAQAAGRLGDIKTADTVLQALLKGGPEDADIYSFMSFVQLEANQLKQAEESARKAIAMDPADIGPLVTLSTVLDRMKKYRDSEETLRKALTISPDDATLLNNLGYFLADRGERIQEAEDLIRRAVNIEPTNGSFLDSLGWVLFKQSKTSEAQKFLEQAAIYSPRSATIRDHLGDLYKKQGQVDKARERWQEALQLATEPEEKKKIQDKLGKK